MTSTRQNKVARLIQKDLSEIFQRNIGQILPGRLITVTTVRISPDLSKAKTYISIFPSPNKEEDLKAIRIKTNFLRNELAIRVKNQMKNIPELSFFIDDSLDYVQNIEDKLS